MKQRAADFRDRFLVPFQAHDASWRTIFRKRSG